MGDEPMIWVGDQLSTTSGTDLDHQAVEMPGDLFKFRSLAGECLEFARQIIADHMIYWSPASELNDPFDCAPLPKLSGGRLVNGLRMRRTLRNCYPGMPKALVKAFAARGASAPARQFEEKMIEQIARYRKEIGVCSLSERYDQEKMWTDYADEHRGICIRFRDPGNVVHFRFAQRVLYSETRPTVPVYGTQGMELLRSYLLTKTQDWSYEAEWRLICQTSPGSRPFPPACLSGVIFGAEISPTDRQLVLAWLDASPTPVELLQARRTARGIEIDPVTS